MPPRQTSSTKSGPTMRSRPVLQSDPNAVFAEMGGRIPDDVEIRVVRDTDTVKHLHIPAAPSEGEIYRQ